MKTATWFLSALLAFSASPAFALRCGSQLVLEGQSTYQVAQKCGQPQWQDHRVVYVATIAGYAPQQTIAQRPQPNVANNKNQNVPPAAVDTTVPIYVEVPINVDEWIYNFGPNQLMQKLTFENDKLVSLRDLGYGN
jgi:hypothetical protein